MGPSVSVRLSRFSSRCYNDFGLHCCKDNLGLHCCNDDLGSRKNYLVLHFTTMVLGHIVATMILDANVALDTTVASFSLLLAVLTSSTVTRCKERLWNFSALQRVHVSNLVLC
jgi:hypothetical protein